VDSTIKVLVGTIKVLVGTIKVLVFDHKSVGFEMLQALVSKGCSLPKNTLKTFKKV